MADSASTRAPLEEVMLAMDVVDTLRHQQVLVSRELDAEGRRERLIQRLKEIYAAQGIEVSEAVLAEGVRALEEDRFRYDPPERGLSTRLAGLYVSRGRWGKPALLVVGVLLLAILSHYFFVRLPLAQERASLPARLDQTSARVLEVAEQPSAKTQAQALLDSARSAIRDEDYARAKERHQELSVLLRALEASYEVRIVSRPGEVSGVWRVPEANPNARNYYLIVEAVETRGNRLQVAVENEEDGRTYTVDSWGLRVDERTFEAVAADKRDDGIIQDDVVGRKRTGHLEPEYLVSTTGATITEW